MLDPNDPIRLLLVEDSEDDAELIRLELERAGFELRCHRVDSEPALREALAQHDWDIVISDYAMPAFNGMEAFRLIQALGIDVPFIFVSGALGEERAVAAMRAGARDYLLKDNLRRLAEAVRRELTEASGRRQRRLAEAAARREARRLAMAVEASGAGIYEHRVPPTADAYYSERWAAILGFEVGDLPAPSEIPGWFESRVHADDRKTLLDAQAEFVAGERPHLETEVRVLHRDGECIWVALRSKPIERDATGHVTHMIGVMLDLTSRRKLEEELRQAQKMEAMGHLAGGVAHDFNNLLTVIHNFSEFVVEELDEKSGAMADMREILEATRRAAALTAQLLAFSRRQPIEPRVVDVNELIGSTERMLQRLLGEKITVVTHLGPNVGKVRVDPRAFEQVLVNLAVNARDAMPRGGTLILETAGADVPDTPGLDLPAGHYVRISVIDDGIGMDEETRERIFEPFFTTKRQGEGTGLGLSTCYGIVQQAHGCIAVESEPGRGSTFRVYLPAAVGRSETATPDVDEARDGTEVVLVAEDDDQVRQLVARILSRRGYRVIEARSAREARHLYEQEDGRVDLLLTDVVLPTKDGRELAAELAAIDPNLAVLYMSGYTADAIAEVGLLSADMPLVHKPFSPESLVGSVRAALDRR
jgi:two-component system, cell cycle sensor histidine kinase and response regulator CckA